MTGRDAVGLLGLSLRCAVAGLVVVTWVGRASPASAALAPGDIALVGFNFDEPDEFAFVALTNITAGEQIKFTDNGWLAANSFRAGEGTFTWTAPANIAAGAVVIPTITSGSFSLSADGDQILAYQGADGSPTHLYALNSEGAAVWQADATSSNTSALPLGLTNGATAVAVTEIDNAIYTGPTVGFRADLLAAISTASNWAGSNTVRQAMPSAFVVLTTNNAGADVIASQNFNALTGTASTNDALGNGQPLTNSGSSNSGGPGLDFATYWFNTRGEATGPSINGTESDFIGVNSFTGSAAPNVGPTGVGVAAGVEQNFEFNDGDGRLELVFEPVNVTGYENVSVTFKYWIADTGYETTGPDALTATLGDGSTTLTILSITGDELDAEASADDGSNNWRMFSVDLPGVLTGPFITLTISVDVNADNENIFIDDVFFRGDAVAAVVPEPASVTLVPLAAVALAVRRRRRRT